MVEPSFLAIGMSMVPDCVGLTGDDGGVLPVNRVVLHGIREDAGTVGILCEKHKP